MYLLDTDHVSILQRGTQPACGRIQQRMALYLLTGIFVSIVSFHEQVMGANVYLSQARTVAALARGYELLEEIRARYARAQVLPFDQQAVNRFQSLRSQHVRIGTMDLRIAAIALDRGMTVVTRNTSDFNQVPGLSVEDWTA